MEIMQVKVGDLRQPGEVGLQESDLLDRMPDGANNNDDATNSVRLVSLGCYCGPKLSFKKLGRGSETLPFDWMRSRLEGIFHFMRTDYDGFFDWSTLHEVGAMKIYRGYYQSFWHDNPEEYAMHERYNRRIARFKDIDAKTQVVLFVRSCSNSDELSFGQELLEELKSRHGAGACLLMIIDFQQTANGAAIIDGVPDLMVYYLNGSAHSNPDGAPYCTPIKVALDWAVGRPIEAMNFVDIETIVDCADPTNWGDEGMNGIAAFESEMPARRPPPLPPKKEVEIGFKAPLPQAVVEVVPETSVEHNVEVIEAEEPPIQIANAQEFQEEFHTKAAEVVEPVIEIVPIKELPAVPRVDVESDLLEQFGAHQVSSDGITVVSLGCFCGPKLTFQKIGRGAETLPFDWVRTSLDGILHFIRNDFEGYFEYKTRKEVPDSSMVMYRSQYHSFWHDNPDSEEMRIKYQRRFARFSNLGESGKPMLFVRAISSMDELLRAGELLSVLSDKFGEQACLLLIADFQQETLGTMFCDQYEELMVYFISSSDRAHDHAAPYSKPVEIAIEWLKGEAIHAGCVENLQSLRALANNAGGGELANFGVFDAFEPKAAEHDQGEASNAVVEIGLRDPTEDATQGTVSATNPQNSEISCVAGILRWLFGRRSP